MTLLGLGTRVACACLVAIGCAKPRRVTDQLTPAVVLREPVYLDSAGVANNTAVVRVAVRVTVRPTEALSDAMVDLLDAASRPVAQASSSPTGAVAFPNVQAGAYTLRVRRIGYEVLTTSVQVTAGCALDVEAYLKQAFIGLDDSNVITVDGNKRDGASARPPALRVTGSRATVTTCKPGA